MKSYQKELFRESYHPRIFLDWWRYKVQFKKDHPYYFNPCGTMVFCGAQGMGKTLSAVNYVYQIMDKYPNCILCTNVIMRDFPFNAYFVTPAKGAPVLASDYDGSLIDSASILAGEHVNVCVEYTGLDCLKYLNNGEYGVVFMIDEFHLQLNSLESKNVDIDVMIEISQQRKQRKHIVCTSQQFMRLAKPVREQISDVIICKCYFGFYQFNKYMDGLTVVEENGKLSGNVKGRIHYPHQVDMYGRYDTYAKMRRYNNEWQGRAREPAQLFERSTING